MSLLDRIDMDVDKARKCNVRIQGRDAELVALQTEGDKKFAILAGGYKLPIDQETFDFCSQKLEDHLRKHIYCK